MLSTDDLKTCLHREFGRSDKLLFVLDSIGRPCQLKEVRERALEAGFNIPASWNPSTTLKRSRGLAIRTPNGWEITSAGKQHLLDLGVTTLSVAAHQVAIDLRRQLSKINNLQTRSFVEEAIGCYEAGYYRAAIVMSWIGALSILYEHVRSNHLDRFNSEAKRVNFRWKNANTTDDLSRMRESEFLDRIAALSIIGQDAKKALKNCLERRNSCGHPNTLEFRANTVAHHIEVLLLNVFRVFQ